MSIYVHYPDLLALNNCVDNKQNYDADQELQISATNMGTPMDPDLPVLTFADNDFDNGGDKADDNSDGNGPTDEDEETNQ